jgi:hypothetical protein
MVLTDSRTKLGFQWITCVENLIPVENGGNVFINYRIKTARRTEMHKKQGKSAKLGKANLTTD